LKVKPSRIKKPKLSIDENYALADVMTHRGIKPFMKLIEQLVEGQEKDVLRYTLLDGTPEELAQIKCRAEGSRKLISDLNIRISYLKNKEDKSNLL